jgi:recombination protein RecA
MGIGGPSRETSGRSGRSITLREDLQRFLANARGSGAASVRTLDELRAPEQLEARWGLAALRGRLVELSARGAVATLTAAIELVVEAQTQSEPVAWITLAAGTFYPPDVADSGVDLAALVVVRVPDAQAAARSAEKLLRSGAFGMVVIDLGSTQRADGRGLPPAGRTAEWRCGYNDISMAMQGRLVTLAQTHDAAVVCITQKSDDAASLGSLVSLRAEALRIRGTADFSITVRALKDKRRGPGWTHSVKRSGPAGF